MEVQVRKTSISTYLLDRGSYQGLQHITGKPFSRLIRQRITVSSLMSSVTPSDLRLCIPNESRFGLMGNNLLKSWFFLNGLYVFIKIRILLTHF